MAMVRTLVLLCVVVCGTVCGSRVLVVSHTPSRGHTTVSDSVVKILLDAGHKVTYISSGSKMRSDGRLTRVNTSSEDHEAGRSSLSIPDLVRDPPSPRQIMAEGGNYAKRILHHEGVQEMLSDPDVGYDAVVAEWYFSGLLAPLAAVYDCPLIWFSTLDASWMSLQLVHEQTSPVYTVDSLASSAPSEPFDISSRLSRIWRQVQLTAWMYYTTYFIEEPAYQQIYHPLFKVRDVPPPNYESMVYNGSLLLVNSHPLVGQSLALPANVKYIGGHHIADSLRPLPKILQNILDRAKHGAILFSLGSEVDSISLPKQMRQQLLQMFGQLEQIVIWKTSEKFEYLPGNVFTWHWIPQKSVLNDSNTMMFISNGGFNSIIEATYYGVPVIGIPITADQCVNVDLARTRGRAMKVDWSDKLAYDLRSAINEVIGNSSYQDNAKKSAEVFKYTIVSPQKELLHHIELVISTRGAHHLRSPALQLSTVQALNLDAIVLLILVLWFITKVIKVIKVHTTSDDEDKKNN